MRFWMITDAYDFYLLSLWFGNEAMFLSVLKLVWVCMSVCVSQSFEVDFCFLMKLLILELRKAENH